MPEIVPATCPECDQETAVLVPEGAEAVDVARRHDPPLPPEADTVVKSTCSNGHGFFVYLRE
jgi:transposase